MTIQELKKSESAFYMLWGEAASKADYDKEKWQEAEKMIFELRRFINTYETIV